MADDDVPALRIAPRVTMKHGRIFAKAWYRYCGEDMWDAFAETELVTWPEDDPKAQGRYQDIEDEILKKMYEAVEGSIAEAFVKAAREVLARERSQRGTEDRT